MGGIAKYVIERRIGVMIWRASATSKKWLMVSLYLVAESGDRLWLLGSRAPNCRKSYGRAEKTL